MNHIASTMTAALVHRGPDDQGLWADPTRGIALGFRRLAIVDLSVEGHQPMRSSSGRYTLVFNGEVYNHVLLRKELQSVGVHFRGHSDTEVILAAFDRWGVTPAVRRFVGMFAIAVWDAQRQELSLIRDRLGIKPMFVYQYGDIVSFASELKAIHAVPDFNPAVDMQALTAYLRYLYVPAPRSIFKHVIKLLPGHILTISNPAASLPEPIAYWSVGAAAVEGQAKQLVIGDDEAVSMLEELLTDAVRLRMQADVPLGALLSGGIDSSTVVSLMQVTASKAVKTFTIGFDQADFDEADHARAVAQYLGTDHTEVRVSGDEALNVIPRLASMFDEPLADPSQIPTYLVSELARRDVTVALTGDGGDELFGGYNRYIAGERMISQLQRCPSILRRASASGVKRVSPQAWNRMGKALRPIFPLAGETRLFGDKLHKVADLLRSDSEASMYRALLSASQHPEGLIAGAQGVDTTHFLKEDAALGLMERMMLADQRTYLPDDLLAKVDRASMAVSLEARVPILDHRVVELAWRLPRKFKVRDGRGKWILRQILHKHVPAELVNRQKMGFSVPMAVWLEGPLRTWAGDLLHSARGHDFLQPATVRRQWDTFLAGDTTNALGIWSVVMFCAWQDRWLSSRVKGRAESPTISA